MADFTAMLEQLHDGAVLTDTEQNTPIVVNKARQFEIPNDFDRNVAFEGDVNTQIITFQIPRYHESHDLSLCGFKKLRWYNRSAGIEGISDLLPLESTESYQLLQWRFPPEAAIKSGTIGFSLVLYDILNGKIAFSWNTAVCEQLSVSASDQDVSMGLGDVLAETLPPKNEILYIDLEKKAIVAPQGFNSTIANYGDIGFSDVYFQVGRFLKGEDLSKAVITILTTFKDKAFSTTITNQFINFTNGSDTNGLLTFVWSVPKEITYNAIQYTGKINIAITFNINNGQKVWRSNIFPNLQIGQSIVDSAASPFLEPNQYIINGESYDYNLPAEYLPGTVALRSSKSNSTQLHKNELIAVYNENNEFQSVKIGTDDGQTVENAASLIEKEFGNLFDKYLSEMDLVIDGNK